MAWNNQGGGGPWGGGGNGGGNPWGTGGRGPGGGNQPPDIEEILRRGQDKVKNMIPGGGFGSGKGIALGLVAVLVAWSLTGIYRVNANEEAVELLFGKYVQRQGPGLHIWFPTPIGEVMTPNVTEVRTISIGSTDNRDRQNGAGEGMMLTGDQNIIDMNFIVQWNLKDVGDYVFNIGDVEGTLRAAAESSMREVVGQANLDYVMTDGRAEIASRTRALLQRIMDDYGSGVNILDVKLQKADPPSEVIDAFNDVQRARQDQERLQNEANAYRNDIVPRAKGQAARLTEDAAAYKERVIKDAEGEAARFTSVYDSYAGSKDVTSQRLYLEALQEVLSKTDKVIIDQGANGQGVVPYLPLPEIQKRSTPSTTRQGGN